MGTIEALATAQQQRTVSDPPGREPVIVSMADIEPEEVNWLWGPYIPIGKLTILEGDPGIGKTWLALQIASIMSNGDPFPGADGIPSGYKDPAQVIYMTAEDGLGDTLRPRLDKAGADVSKVFALTGWRGNENGKEKNGTITLSDLDVIEKTLKQVNPALVVIDPLQAYLGAGVDMHRANEVRPVLSGMAAIAEKYRCAVLCIRHLGKSQKDRAVYRGLGSIDFAAAARSILLVGEDPNDADKRVLAHSKSSLAKKGCSIAFELRGDGFFWCGTSSVSADELLSPPRAEEERSAVEEAAEFLKESLRDGARPARDVIREAAQAGVNEKSLRRAMEQGKPAVIKKRINVGGQGQGFWQWAIQDEEVF
jgi:hypothetical protein